MASDHVLRIPRSDNDGDFVLVNVTSSAGPSELDLRLLATEGESPYTLDLKHSRIQRYRAKAGQLDEAQWEDLLYAKLLRRPDKQIVMGSRKDETLEVRAVITGEQMTILFRKNISGITQRLGEITLAKDEAQEVDAVAWASTAVLRCDDLEKEADELKRRYEDQQSIIRNLQQQLEDLIEAKKMHETALLEKFRDLLNSKKLKIRNQQRILIESKAGSRKADQSPSKRHELLPTNPTPLNPRKRKARGTSSAASASSTGFDSDQVLEEATVAHEREEPPLATPERSDPSMTEDEDDDDDEASRNPVLQTQNSTNPTSQGVTSNRNAKPAASPPPRRELPFSRPQASLHAASASTSPAKADQASENNDGDGDETSDDEL